MALQLKIKGKTSDFFSQMIVLFYKQSLMSLRESQMFYKKKKNYDWIVKLSNECNSFLVVIPHPGKVQ